MTHRNADTTPTPGETLIIDGEAFTVVETPTDFPPKHKSADQRIREAFEALRAEIEAVFKVDTLNARDSYPIACLLERASQVEDQLHAWAKLPADA